MTNTVFFKGQEDGFHRNITIYTGPNSGEVGTRSREGDDYVYNLDLEHPVNQLTRLLELLSLASKGKYSPQIHLIINNVDVLRFINVYLGGLDSGKDLAKSLGLNVKSRFLRINMKYCAEDSQEQDVRYIPYEGFETTWESIYYAELLKVDKSLASLA